MYFEKARTRRIVGVSVVPGPVGFGESAQPLEFGFLGFYVDGVTGIYCVIIWSYLKCESPAPGTLAEHIARQKNASQNCVILSYYVPHLHVLTHNTFRIFHGPMKQCRFREGNISGKVVTGKLTSCIVTKKVRLPTGRKVGAFHGPVKMCTILQT